MAAQVNTEYTTGGRAKMAHVSAGDWAPYEHMLEELQVRADKDARREGAAAAPSKKPAEPNNKSRRCGVLPRPKQAHARARFVRCETMTPPAAQPPGCIAAQGTGIAWISTAWAQIDPSSRIHRHRQYMEWLSGCACTELSEHAPAQTCLAVQQVYSMANGHTVISYMLAHAGCPSSSGTGGRPVGSPWMRKRKRMPYRTPRLPHSRTAAFPVHPCAWSFLQTQGRAPAAGGPQCASGKTEIDST